MSLLHRVLSLSDHWPIFTGITTLLTTCTVGLTGREGIPKVSYSTALDVYLLMCFSFVFAALVEYAGVNYFTKTGFREGTTESDEVIIIIIITIKQIY